MRIQHVVQESSLRLKKAADRIRGWAKHHYRDMTRSALKGAAYRAGFVAVDLIVAWWIIRH